MTRLQQQNTTYFIHSFRYSTKNKGQLIQWISTRGHWSIEVRVLVQNVWISFLKRHIFQAPRPCCWTAASTSSLSSCPGPKGKKLEHVTGQKCFISFYHRFGIHLSQDAPTRMMKTFFKANQVPPQLNPSFATMAGERDDRHDAPWKQAQHAPRLGHSPAKPPVVVFFVFGKTGYKNAETHIFAPWKIGQQNPKGIIQPSIFRCKKW